MTSTTIQSIAEALHSMEYASRIDKDLTACAKAAFIAAAPSIVQLAVELGAEVERLEAQFDQMRALRKDEGKRLRRIAVRLSPDSALGIVQHELNQLADGLECGDPLGDCGCEGSCFTCGDCDRCNP